MVREIDTDGNDEIDFEGTAASGFAILIIALLPICCVALLLCMDQQRMRKGLAQPPA